MFSYKTGILLAYQLLDVLYSGGSEHIETCSKMLYAWLASNYNTKGGILSEQQDDVGISYHEQRGGCPLHLTLEGLMLRLHAGETVSMREYNSLRKPLVEILANWMGEIKLCLLLHSSLQPEFLGIWKETRAVLLTGNNDVAPDTDERSIHLLLTSNTEVSDKLLKKTDMQISIQKLMARARFCFPVDNFDYDRLYLTGKLQSLSENCKRISIVLSGSSYAMVGLKENMMPRPAVNLAVNAQDPYFSMLSAETVIKSCKGIDTVVITGGYYFWHTDMSNNPSDYYKSVLMRTNYPVLRSLHKYEGELLPAMQRTSCDPLLEKLFDFEALCEKENEGISARLANLEYFNKEINQRPINGMLHFPFRELSDDINYRTAKARAEAHNGNLSQHNLESNMKILLSFLSATENQVRVIIVVPPVTKFYRVNSSPQLKEMLYEQLKAVKEAFDIVFLDLFDSQDFDVYDFQDYDHLNDNGAKKLSRIVGMEV